MSSVNNTTQHCTKCNQTDIKLLLCAKCLSTPYCSRKCQKAHWKIHKHECQANTALRAIRPNATPSQSMYEIKDIEGKGLGMIASTEIPKGTRILGEESIFDVNLNVFNIELLETQIRMKISQLQQEQAQAFFNLHNIYGKEHSSALGIARTNALPLGVAATKVGIFLEASRINHSCAHNAQNTWNSNIRRLTIHAVCDIKEGEEICISYLDGSNGYAGRQKNLQTDFKFTCTCSLCSLPEELRRQSDTRRSEITRLDESISDGMSIVSTPLSCLHNAYRLLQLLHEERTTEALIPRPYYDAFQIVIANGDEARARSLAKMAYDWRVVLEGEDSDSAVRLKQLVENPRSHTLYGTSMKWKQSVAKIPSGVDEQEFEKWLWRIT